MVINVHSLSAASLKAGDYRSELPEFYALAGIVENNAWHLKQDVLLHVITVVEALQGLFSLEFLDGALQEKGQEYLSKRVGKFSAKELLLIATVLHDVAKSEIYIKDPHGGTRCPGHEIIGASRIKRFSERFGLDNEGEQRVSEIVRLHGFVVDVLTLALNLGAAARHVEILRDAAPGIALELTLFAYADMLGSDLKKINEQEFVSRERLVKEFIKFAVLKST